MFFAIVIIALWERGVVLLFNEQIPSIIECFVSSFVENSPVVLEKKMKIGKVYIRIDGQTDDQKGSRAFSSGELKWKQSNGKTQS